MKPSPKDNQSLDCTGMETHLFNTQFFWLAISGEG